MSARSGAWILMLAVALGGCAAGGTGSDSPPGTADAGTDAPSNTDIADIADTTFPDDADATSDAGEADATDATDVPVLDLARVHPIAEALPDAVRYVVERADGVARATCGTVVEADPGLSCDGLDLLLESGADGAPVLVKARGHAFAAGTTPEDGATRDLPLTPLPPPDVTDDYRTGFAADGVDAFRALSYEGQTELGPVELVKFLVTGLDGAPIVYFQNTKKQPLHYTFAQSVLGLGMSLSDFEAATYHGADRTMMAGTLVRYPGRTVHTAGGDLTSPVAVTFFPSDDLSPAQALRVHGLVEERLGFAPLWGGDGRVTYLPAGTVQQAQLDGAVPLFAAHDAAWFTQADLWGSTEIQLLNPGVAFGTLRVMSPEELAVAVVSFTDVLVLTRLPNELPIVGGTITEELQTPLAHVNVAARARGTPNMALLGASTDPQVAPLVGALVRFEVTADGFDLREATVEEATAFWKEATDKPPLVPEADLERDGLLPFDTIGFGDAIAVGVKAANVAELSHLLGAGAPHGFAVPFHHYDRFMAEGLVNALLCKGARADCAAEGRPAAICDAAFAFCAASPGETLFGFVDRLLDDATVQTDTPLREAVLDNLRWLIGHIPVAADFGDALDAEVAADFGDAKVRLRSSTNAEDLPQFSGAGLYTSVGGYASGKDRASDVIRHVFASTWNFSAFEERTFWNIDHRAVRMGVAVHQAFEGEEANGVLLTQNIADPSVVGYYVNVQIGDVPVTNPVGGALPEVFTIVPAPTGVQVVRQRYSSLSPGVPVMTEAEIAGLASTATKIQMHFAPLYGVNPAVLTLDMELKLLAGTRELMIKQVRPYFQAH